MRKALGTLPWVEHDTIQTSVPEREVRFDLKDKGAFSVEEIEKALKKEGFKEVTVQSAPPGPDQPTP